MEGMLERLARKSHYCCLDGFSGFHQILVAPEDQENTTFTCPFGTFAYRRMPFGLYNAPATFHRCTNVREVRSFLGHAGFYRRFIKDFLKISFPMCQLLQKDAEFDFNEDCKKAFDALKIILLLPPSFSPQIGVNHSS
uniref:Reverse transcriptase domain-containing protein n=1 Tax=Lactuca sativa TaxID=4236 RepID=A0A9R1XJX2_LACSA|nr:hypothetical protein LSAT_V11C400218350 [Lactuca sativa]